MPYRNDLILYQRNEGLSLRDRWVLNDEQVNDLVKYLRTSGFHGPMGAVVDEHEGITWKEDECLTNQVSPCTAQDVTDSTTVTNQMMLPLN